MIARLLCAELSREDLGVEERGTVHDDDALALCVLVFSQLGIGGRKKRMGERLNVASWAQGDGAVTSLDCVVVASEEIVGST